MKEYLEKLMTSRNIGIILAVLNLISVIISIRAIFKTKSTLKALFHLACAGAGAYMIYKNSKDLKSMIGK